MDDQRANGNGTSRTWRKSSIKGISVEAILANPDMQFAWCRWHLADAGFMLRIRQSVDDAGYLREDGCVVWRARQPRAIRVYFNTLEDLITLVAERRFDWLVSRNQAARVTAEALGN